MRHSNLWRMLLLVVLIALFFLLNLLLGSVAIPADSIGNILIGQGNEPVAWQNIVWKSRLPQALTALAAGAGLAISGLQMQTVFRNPLAGPSVLGISSGASLGVAFVILLSGSIGGVALSRLGIIGEIAKVNQQGQHIISEPFKIHVDIHAQSLKGFRPIPVVSYFAKLHTAYYGTGTVDRRNIFKGIAVIPAFHFLHIHLIFSHEVWTSFSVKPTNSASGPGSVMENSSNIFRAECVPYFLWEGCPSCIPDEHSLYPSEYPAESPGTVPARPYPPEIL